VPPKTETEQLKHVRLLIKNHVELHQKDLMSQMTDEKSDLHNDRVRSIKGLYYTTKNNNTLYNIGTNRKYEKSAIMDYRYD
jgi:hypothetical protein